jgi:hypothetical protein
MPADAEKKVPKGVVRYFFPKDEEISAYEVFEHRGTKAQRMNPFLSLCLCVQ